MRFIFKTDYGQDIKLAKHGGHIFWYSLLMLALVAAPWMVEEYWLAQLTFVLIYAIAGLGLMLLAGFTGLFSIGHAAFLGVGAFVFHLALVFVVAVFLAFIFFLFGTLGLQNNMGSLYGKCRTSPLPLNATYWPWTSDRVCTTGAGFHQCGTGEYCGFAKDHGITLA